MAIQGYDSAPASLRAAMAEASAKTGVSEEYLIRLAGKESTFNPQARPGINPKTGNRYSSAQGAYQFLDDTWTRTTAAHGAKYGITGQTSRFDPRASALMAAEFTKDNQASLRKALKREPTGGELYMAHFMGAAGAASFISAKQKNPDAHASDIFKDQAAANPGIFYADKGKLVPRSLDAVYGRLTEAFEGRYTDKAQNTGTKLESNIYGTEEPVEKLPIPELLNMAMEQENGTVMAFQFLQRMGNADYAPDREFRWTQENLKLAGEGLDEETTRYVIDNAQSFSQIEYYRQKARDDAFNEQALSEAGPLANFGLRGTAVMADPLSWLAGGGAGKIVQGGVTATRLARAAEAGLVAVAGSVPTEIMKAAERPSYGVDDVLINGTTAFAFGASFGAAFGHNGRKLDEVFERESYAAERAGITRSGATLTPAGEAYYAKGTPKAPTSGGSAATPLAESGQLGDMSLARRADISVQGRIQRTPNPEVRELGTRLDLDAVGDGGRTLRADESAYEYMRRTGQSADVAVKRVHEDAFDEWAKEVGLPIQQRLGPGRDAFDEMVGKEIMAPDGSNPHVSKAANAHRQGYADWLSRAKTEGAEWAQNIPNDERYFPMVFDKGRIREAVSKFDDAGVISVIRQAFVRAQNTLEPALAERVAERYLKVIRDVTEGTQGTVAHAIAGLDNAGLKQLLEDAGLAADDAENFIAANKPVQKTGPSNFRQKAILDDTTRFPVEGSRKGEMMSVRDLTDMNATRVWERYNRSLSGHVAMVRAGFQTRGAFEKAVLDMTKGQANWNAAFTDTVAEVAMKDLKYLGDHVYGIPHENIDPRLARVASIFGDFNFARVMGQSGIAQLGDIPKIFLNTSIQSAWETFNLSDFMRVFKKGGDEAFELANDLEVLTGVGTSRGRTTIVPMFKDVEEFYAESLSTVALDRVKRVTKTMANVTGVVSGMTPIVDFMSRWAVRAHLQHAADLAKGIRKASPKIMNDLGLDQAALDTFKPLFEKMTYRGRTIQSMNLKALKAAHPEALDKLAAYVSRRARLSVLEHSPGMLPRWAGSTVGRIASQFRTFQMASHAANTLHNIRMGPGYAAQSLMVTGLWSGAIYGLHTYTKSIGREDQQEYLDRALSPTTWAASAFGRSADSGILTTVYSVLADPVHAATDTKNPFNYGRTSGLAAGIQGIPMVDLLTSVQGGITEGAADIFRDDKLATTEDMKRLQRLVPLNNTYGIANAFQAITGLFPDDEPSEDGNWGK